MDITPAAGCLSPSGKLWAGPPRRALPPATDSAVTHNQISGRLPTAPAAGLASAVIHNQNICQPNRGSWTARLAAIFSLPFAWLRLQSTCYLNCSRAPALYFPEIWLLVNLSCEFCSSAELSRSMKMNNLLLSLFGSFSFSLVKPRSRVPPPAQLPITRSLAGLTPPRRRPGQRCYP